MQNTVMKSRKERVNMGEAAIDLPRAEIISASTVPRRESVIRRPFQTRAVQPIRAEFQPIPRTHCRHSFPSDEHHRDAITHFLHA